MAKVIKYIGLDVHKNSIAIAVADFGASNEVRYYGEIDNNNERLLKVLRSIAKDGACLSGVYEAGPCGYELQRFLSLNGIKCFVVAPSKIPRKSGDRIKNDKRDALNLARLHRAGELTSVYVPSPEDEALRDLVRAREDAQKALRQSKQQLGAFLLRHNLIFTGRSAWSKAFFNWLTGITMKHRAQQLTLQEYINTVEGCTSRVQRFTEQIAELVKESQLYSLIKSLQAMRGVSLIVAATTIAELGDLKRFESPAKLMAYLGLVPSESSSGPKVRRGPITKTGNSHVRKALIEGSHAYRLPSRIGRDLRKRQDGLSEEVRQIAWKAQVRLCKRYQQLAARGKHANVIKTAIAREMAAFFWAIAQHV